jgi:hypothetical protein
VIPGNPDDAAPEPGGGPAAPAAEPEPRPRRRWLRRGWRWSRRTLALALALVAALLVSIFTIDLGRFPQVKQQAEKYGSQFLKRAMHIGRIEATLAPGRFVIRDLVIDGTPDSRPFFTAKTITINVSWWTLVDRDLILDVAIDDWTMSIEKWPDHSNMPNFKRQGASTGKRSFTTTMQQIHARRGHFIYEDHGTPWGVDAPGLEFSMAKSRPANTYVGTARFDGGSVHIMQYEPMATSFSTRYTLDKGIVTLHHIDLINDGAESHVNGFVDFNRWPLQTYNVNSTVDFRRMRERFFPSERWDVGGTGTFAGVFEVTKDGQRLEGQFGSDRADVNRMPFRDLHGSLVWEKSRFAVTHADADLFGGRTRFSYAIEPLGRPGGATQRFVADYHDVDLSYLDRFIDLKGLRLAGLLDGDVALAWPSGRLGTHLEGGGKSFVRPPAGAQLAPAVLPPNPRYPPGVLDAPPAGPLPVGAAVAYHFDADGFVFDHSWAATPSTYIAFNGPANRIAARLPFHVTSTDWQESARLLASIMTAVSGPTSPIEVSGYGTFDGLMTESFSAPRIEGHFAGDALHVWRVTWGRATGDIVLQNKYVDITGGLIERPGQSIRADGRFSLGYPRKDAGVEIDARVQLSHWPLSDLKTAFQMTDWPIDATIDAGDVQLRGAYERPVGTGHLKLDRGVAWGETFTSTEGDLTFDGRGVNFTRVQMAKSTGVVRADAFFGWDKTYSFTATGDRIPVESLDNFKVERAPLTGLLKFRATGSARLDAPSYRVHGEIDYLFAGDEGLGPVAGDISVANNVLTFEQLTLVSPRLQLNGSGRLALAEPYTSELRFQFVNSSLDPYLKFFEFGKTISPYTRAIVSGSLRVSGPLTDLPNLTVNARVEEGALTFFDYELRNEGDIDLTLEKNAITIGQFKLVGEGTNLSLSGGISLADRTMDVRADGDAGLAILQNADFRAGGSARLTARATGPFDNPVFTGTANIRDGSLRPAALRHSFTAINGLIRFDQRSINLEGLRATLAGGDVQLGGSISLANYAADEFNLTATGHQMQLRYPAGFSSNVDAALTLTGPFASPLLAGTVTVNRSRYLPGTDSRLGLLGIVLGGFGAAEGPSLAPAADGEGPPIRLDVTIHAPSRSIHLDNPVVGAHIEASGELFYQGTYNNPALTGQLEIDAGEVNFNGNRILVRSGSIALTNPARLDPYFDVQAETRVVAPGQTYVVNLGLSGTLESIRYTISSEPSLPETDVITLLLGARPDLGRAETRALTASQEAKESAMQTFAAQLVASPLTASVNSVFDRIPGSRISFQPILSNESSQLTPSARITYAQQIAPRLYLTYSSTLAAGQYDLILLEYEQNERVSWVLSRNEDRTFALDIRFRYVF